MLALKVNGAISVPFGKATAVELVFYFCPKRHCFTKVLKWCNVKALVVFLHQVLH